MYATAVREVWKLDAEEARHSTGRIALKCYKARADPVGEGDVSEDRTDPIWFVGGCMSGGGRL